MVKTITKGQALNIIKATNGRIFTAEFYKKNGEYRKINCRLGVKSYLNGGELRFDPKLKGLIPVFDLQSQGYRMINLNTLTSIRDNKVSYVVEDESHD